VIYMYMYVYWYQAGPIDGSFAKGSAGIDYAECIHVYVQRLEMGLAILFVLNAINHYSFHHAPLELLSSKLLSGIQFDSFYYYLLPSFFRPRIMKRTR
jgi:hypothetical protein